MTTSDRSGFTWGEFVWRPPRHRFRTSHGEVAHDTMGDGPPLVVVHGTPWSSFSWHRIIPALAAEFTIYTYDLLGYGRSQKGPGLDVSLGVQNEVLAQLLDHWGLASPRVLAHDFGGATVLRAHLRDGCGFERIVLVDPVALSPWGSVFFRLVRENTDVFRELPAPIHEAVVRAYVAGAVHTPLDEASLANIVEPWIGDVGQFAFYEQMAQARMEHTDEIEGRYATIDVPCLIVWGAEDAWIPVDRGWRLHEMIPGSRFAVIEEAGHLVQEDRPGELVDVLRPFLLEPAA